MNSKMQMLDHSALKFNQISIIVLVLLGFIVDQPAFPAVVAAVLLGGSLNQRLALFKLIYKRVIKPLRLLKPDILEGSPAPHEFAQLLGGVVLGLGVFFLYSGSNFVGWALSWVVILLAAMNLFFGFCAGCFVYYQLGKLGLPGFQPRSS